METRVLPQIDKDHLEVLALVRQEVIKRHFLKAKIFAFKEEMNNKAAPFKLGQLVLVYMNPHQHRKISQIEGATKLIPQWSLPMRIESLSQSGLVALARCIYTGLVQQIRADRARLILPPLTPSQLREWELIIDAERPLFQALYNNRRSKKTKDIPGEQRPQQRSGPKWKNRQDDSSLLQTLVYHHDPYRGRDNENPPGSVLNYPPRPKPRLAPCKWNYLKRPIEWLFPNVPPGVTHHDQFPDEQFLELPREMDDDEFDE